MLKSVLFLAVLVMPIVGYSAQQKPDSTGRGVVQQSITAQVGLTGIGAFYNRLLSPSHRLAIRVGGQFLGYQQSIRVKTAPNSYIVIDPDFMISTAQANLKWHPLRRSSFFVAAGLGYTWHPYLNFVITAQDKLNLGGLELTPADVGTINLGFRWHSVVGYAGWGFGQTILRKRIGVGVEMGIYYLGRPSVQLNYEGFLETTTIDEQVPVVERNLSNYRFLPTINFTLTYTLRRSH